MRSSGPVLLELHIRDFALIDELDLVFGPGLNAIAGETGSGKSLLVTALEVLLGQRPKGGPKAPSSDGLKAFWDVRWPISRSSQKAPS